MTASHNQIVVMTKFDYKSESKITLPLLITTTVPYQGEYYNSVFTPFPCCRCAISYDSRLPRFPPFVVSVASVLRRKEVFWVVFFWKIIRPRISPHKRGLYNDGTRCSCHRTTASRSSIVSSGFLRLHLACVHIFLHDFPRL